MSRLDDDPATPLNFDWESEMEEEMKKEAKELDPIIDAFPPTSSSGEKEYKDETEESSSKREASAAELPPFGYMPPVVRRKKKRKGMPKRPLSAYNIFFQMERPKILESGDNRDCRIGFEDLGKIVGKRWQTLAEEERKEYERLAEKDSIRYRKEMETFNEAKRKRLEAADKAEKEKATPSLELNPPPLSSDKISVFPISVASPENTTTLPKPLATRGRIPGTQILVQDPQQQSQTGAAGLSTFPPLVQQPRPQPLPPIQPAQYVLQQAPPQVSIGQCGPARTNFLVDAANQAFPVPPGMEITIPDVNGRERRYKVQYAVYSMPEQAAHQYIESLTTSIRHPVQLPVLSPQYQQYSLQPQQQPPQFQQQPQQEQGQMLQQQQQQQPQHESQQQQLSRYII